MTDKNPYEDFSTELLTEDVEDAIQLLSKMIAQHKLIIAASPLFTKAELLESYASLVNYLEMVATASKMAQEAVLMTRENVVIDPDN